MATQTIDSGAREHSVGGWGVHVLCTVSPAGAQHLLDSCGYRVICIWTTPKLEPAVGIKV